MTGELFVLGLLALVTVLLSVIIWSVFATARTRVSAGQDAHGQSYEELAGEVAQLRADVERLSADVKRLQQPEAQR